MQLLTLEALKGGGVIVSLHYFWVLWAEMLNFPKQELSEFFFCFFFTAILGDLVGWDSNAQTSSSTIRVKEKGHKIFRSLHHPFCWHFCEDTCSFRIFHFELTTEREWNTSLLSLCSVLIEKVDKCRNVPTSINEKEMARQAFKFYFIFACRENCCHWDVFMKIQATVYVIVNVSFSLGWAQPRNSYRNRNFFPNRQDYFHMQTKN